MRTILVCLAVLIAYPAVAQEEAPGGAAASLDTYSYDAAGKRDPFLSLVRGTPEMTSTDCQDDRLGCINIDEIDIQGIWQIGGEWIAEIQAKDTNVYWLKVGDSLHDGEVLAIDEKNIAFKQKVNDPTRIKPYREVVRSLFEEKVQGRSQ